MAPRRTARLHLKHWLLLAPLLGCGPSPAPCPTIHRLVSLARPDGGFDADGGALDAGPPPATSDCQVICAQSGLPWVLVGCALSGPQDTPTADCEYDVPCHA